MCRRQGPLDGGSDAPCFFARAKKKGFLIDTFLENANTTVFVRPLLVGIVTFAHAPSGDNYADILTKPLNNATFLKLVSPLLFRRPRTVVTRDGKAEADKSEST